MKIELNRKEHIAIKIRRIDNMSEALPVVSPLSDKDDEQEDDDEDEDFQDYFLKPAANEYDIQEKIKEANEQLFSQLKANELAQLEEGLNRRRLVTFRSNLEDHEPTKMLSTPQCASAISSLESLVVEQEYDEPSEQPEDDKLSAVLNEEVEDEDIIEEVDEIEDNIVDSMDRLVLQSDQMYRVINEEETAQSTYEAQPKNHPSPINGRTAKRDRPIKIKTIKIKRPSLPKVLQPELGTTALDNTGTKYRYCCVHKCYDGSYQKLPKYNGLNSVSHYGLSREQLEMKVRRRERRKRIDRELAFKKFNENLERSVANEEAFAKWLKRKLRAGPLRNRNMYDEGKRKKAVVKNDEHG